MTNSINIKYKKCIRSSSGRPYGFSQMVRYVCLKIPYQYSGDLLIYFLYFIFIQLVIPVNIIYRNIPKHACNTIYLRSQENSIGSVWRASSGTQMILNIIDGHLKCLWSHICSPTCFCKSYEISPLVKPIGLSCRPSGDRRTYTKCHSQSSETICDN